MIGYLKIRRHLSKSTYIKIFIHIYLTMDIRLCYS